MAMPQTKIIPCACNTPSHHIIYMYSEDGPEVYMYANLNVKLPFLKRVVNGLKYIFGIQIETSNYFEMYIDERNVESLEEICKHIKKYD